MGHEMPNSEHISPFPDLSSVALVEAKKKLEGEGINPANIGILGQNLAASLAEKLAAAEESNGEMFAKELARYLKDDLENGFRDLFPEEVSAIAKKYLDDYMK